MVSGMINADPGAEVFVNEFARAVTQEDHDAVEELLEMIADLEVDSAVSVVNALLRRCGAEIISAIVSGTALAQSAHGRWLDVLCQLNMCMPALLVYAQNSGLLINMTQRMIMFVQSPGSNRDDASLVAATALASVALLTSTDVESYFKEPEPEEESLRAFLGHDVVEQLAKSLADCALFCLRNGMIKAGDNILRELAGSREIVEQDFGLANKEDSSEEEEEEQSNFPCALSPETLLGYTCEVTRVLSDLGRTDALKNLLECSDGLRALWIRIGRYASENDVSEVLTLMDTMESTVESSDQSEYEKACVLARVWLVRAGVLRGTSYDTNYFALVQKLTELLKPSAQRLSFGVTRNHSDQQSETVCSIEKPSHVSPLRVGQAALADLLRVAPREDATLAAPALSVVTPVIKEADRARRELVRLMTEHPDARVRVHDSLADYVGDALRVVLAATLVFPVDMAVHAREFIELLKPLETFDIVIGFVRPTLVHLFDVGIKHGSTKELMDEAFEFELSCIDEDDVGTYLALERLAQLGVSAQATQFHLQLLEEVLIRVLRCQLPCQCDYEREELSQSLLQEADSLWPGLGDVFDVLYLEHHLPVSAQVIESAVFVFEMLMRLKKEHPEAASVVKNLSALMPLLLSVQASVQHHRQDGAALAFPLGGMSAHLLPHIDIAVVDDGLLKDYACLVSNLAFAVASQLPDSRVLRQVTPIAVSLIPTLDLAQEETAQRAVDNIVAMALGAVVSLGSVDIEGLEFDFVLDQLPLRSDLEEWPTVLGHLNAMPDHVLRAHVARLLPKLRRGHLEYHQQVDSDEETDALFHGLMQRLMQLH